MDTKTEPVPGITSPDKNTIAEAKSGAEIGAIANAPLDDDTVLTDFWYKAYSYLDDKSRTAFRTTSSNNQGQIDHYRWRNLAKLEKIEQWRLLSWHCARYQKFLTWSAKDKQFIIDSLLVYVKEQPPSTIHKAVALTTLALLGTPDKNGELSRQLNFALECLSWIDTKMADVLKSTLCTEKNYYDSASYEMSAMLEWVAVPDETMKFRQWNSCSTGPLWTSLLTLRPGTTKRLALNLISFTPPYNHFESYYSRGAGRLPLHIWRLESIQRNVSQLSSDLCEQLIFYYLKILSYRHYELKQTRSMLWETIFSLMKHIPDVDIGTLGIRRESELDKTKGLTLIFLLLLHIRAGQHIDWQQWRQIVCTLTIEETATEFFANITSIAPFMSEQTVTDLCQLILKEAYIQYAPHHRVTWQLLKAITSRISPTQAQDLFIPIKAALACSDAQYASCCFANIIPLLGHENLPEILSAYDVCYSSLSEIDQNKDPKISHYIHYYGIFSEAVSTSLIKIAALISKKTLPELISRLEQARQINVWQEMPRGYVIKPDELLQALPDDELRGYFYDTYISSAFPLIVPITPALPERSHQISSKSIYCEFLPYTQTEYFIRMGKTALALPLPPDEPVQKKYAHHNELCRHILTLLKILASSPHYCQELELQTFSDILRAVFQLSIDNKLANMRRNDQTIACLYITEVSPYLIRIMQNVNYEQALAVCNSILERYDPPYPNPDDEPDLPGDANSLFFSLLILLRTRYDSVIDLDKLFAWMKFFLEHDKQWYDFSSHSTVLTDFSKLLPLFSKDQCQEYYFSCINRWLNLRQQLGPDGKAYKPSSTANQGRVGCLSKLQVEFMVCLSHRLGLSSFDSTKIFEDNYFAEPLVINGIDLFKELKNGTNENEPIADRCSKALTQITTYCDRLTQLSELQALRRRLFNNAYQDPELAYLFARRGIFTTCTLNRYQFFNRAGEAIDCSETAVKIQEIIQARYDELIKENNALINELTESDDEFLEQTGSGWTNTLYSGYE